jgi:hypothetical protein
MPLNKLTQSGEVRALHQWARPGVHENWLGLVEPADYLAIVQAMNSYVDHANVIRFDLINTGHFSCCREPDKSSTVV